MQSYKPNLFRSLTPIMCEVYRHLSLTSVLSSKSSHKFVRKFLIEGNQAKKRRKYHDTKMLMNPATLAEPQRKGEKNSHRIHVLNRVFLQKICDILSTGAISPLFTGYGLEISKVQVSPDISSINVHWFCTGSLLDNTLEKILQDNASNLRFELSKQRVIGRVPPIKFVKDQRYFKLMEVERRLAIADFGEDFEPTSPSHQVKSYKTLQMEFDKKLKNALVNTEDSEDPEDFFMKALKLQSSQSTEEEEPKFEDLPPDLPQMRSDILGVDTQKIFYLVRHGMSRSQAEHRRSSDTSPLDYTSHNQHSIDTPIGASRTEEIRLWASKYEQLQQKERHIRKKEVECVSLYPEDDGFEDAVLEAEEEGDFLDENI